MLNEKQICYALIAMSSSQKYVEGVTSLVLGDHGVEWCVKNYS